jgi:hypothetical protein
MSRFRAALALLVLLPAVATAQRGGGGGGRGMGGSTKADFGAIDKNAAPRGPSIAGRDLEKASPLADLLDKKKDLKLSEAQLTTLKDADLKLREANAERYKLVDSLKKEMRPGTSAEDEARVVLSREAMMGVIRDIRTSYDAAAKEIVGKLDEAQQKTAGEILEKNAEDTQEMLRDKLGGRAGGPPGRGRGGL